MKDNDSCGKKGLSEQQKFDVKKPLRGQTGDDKGQRPVQQTSTMKSDKGQSFKVMG
jgi:hypothetical protein